MSDESVLNVTKSGACLLNERIAKILLSTKYALLTLNMDCNILCQIDNFQFFPTHCFQAKIERRWDLLVADDEDI